MSNENPYSKSPMKGVKGKVQPKHLKAMKAFSEIVDNHMMKGKSAAAAMAKAHALGNSKTMQDPDNIPGTPSNQGPVRPGW